MRILTSNLRKGKLPRKQKRQITSKRAPPKLLPMEILQKFSKFLETCSFLKCKTESIHMWQLTYMIKKDKHEANLCSK